MTITQKILVNLLSSAIRADSPEIIEDKSIDWKAVYEEAKLHAVHPLLFPVVNSIKDIQTPNPKLLSEWQNTTLSAGANQIQHIYQTSRVLDEFNKAGIQVIALKGLVLRDLYPQPELRTMGDTDILIHKEDMKAAKALLQKMGYNEGPCSEKHIYFSHENYPAVEVHWTLVDSTILKKAAWFDKTVWANAIPYRIGDSPVLVLSIEYELLHACLHMAHHIIDSGFGLRQLCDFVLLFEKTTLLADWISFNEKVEACGLESFFYALLAACKKLFFLEIPEALQSRISDEAAHIEGLICDILDAGVFGKTSINRMSGNRLLHYTRGKKKTATFQVYLSLLFPATQKLGSKYGYARKHPILTPAAWIHRLMYIIFSRNYTLSEKKKFISFNEVLPVLDRRAKLLEGLGLQ